MGRAIAAGFFDDDSDVKFEEDPVEGIIQEAEPYFVELKNYLKLLLWIAQQA